MSRQESFLHQLAFWEFVLSHTRCQGTRVDIIQCILACEFEAGFYS